MKKNWEILQLFLKNGAKTRKFFVIYSEGIYKLEKFRNNLIPKL